MRQCLAIAALLTAVISLCGCTTNPDAAREQIKRNADGSEKRGEKQDASESSSSQRDRDLSLIVTPGPVNLDPDLLPEAPEKRPVATGAKVPVSPAAQNPPAWHPPMLQPQTITVVDGDRSYTLPVFPGAKIELKSTESKADAKATASTRELTTEEAWQAVRHAPREIWYIAAAGLLLSIIPLFVRGYRWLCPVIAGGTTLATVAFVLTYSQGQTLAYALTGVIGAGALFAMLVIWLTLRGKLRMQDAMIDITSGIELAKKSITAAAAQTTDATAMAALNQARSFVTTSLGVEQNDSTKALVARIKAGGL